MASIRGIKNDLDYLISEVISDCYVRLYFQPEKKRDEVIGLIEEAVAFRNETFHRINHPAEKHNKSLVRKHYSAIRRDMMTRVDELFKKLCDLAAK